MSTAPAFRILKSVTGCAYVDFPVHVANGSVPDRRNVLFAFSNVVRMAEADDTHRESMLNMVRTANGDHRDVRMPSARKLRPSCTRGYHE
jgi:hypothetical protein